MSSNHQAPSLETYMPHIATHAWMIYDLNGPVYTVNNTFTGLLHCGPSVSVAFFRDVLLSPGSVGVENIVPRIKREFQRTQTAKLLCRSTALLFPLSHLPDILSFFGEHALMTEASRMVDKIRDGPGTTSEKTTAYTIILGYLRSALWPSTKANVIADLF